MAYMILSSCRLWFVNEGSCQLHSSKYGWLFTQQCKIIFNALPILIFADIANIFRPILPKPLA